MGAELGTMFARARHGVVFSYAQSVGKLKKVLTGQHAYEGEGGPELAYRFERFVE
jgi:hypothetical protein